MNWLLDRLDRVAEGGTRAVAQRVSRRSVVTGVGRLLLAGALVLPVLPFDRTSQARAAEPGGDPKRKRAPTDSDCDYWKHCSIDGFLCSCCGGSVTECPSGTDPGKVSWVGTCHNPGDGKDYLISYTDCCGRTSCARCQCNTNVGEKPGYRMGKHNDVNWCMSNDSTVYHCTISVIVGVI